MNYFAVIINLQIDYIMMDGGSANRALTTMQGQCITWNNFEEAFHFNNQPGLRIHRHLTKKACYINTGE